MWYCTKCGKRNISDETKWVCDKCGEITKELMIKGENKPSLYCHSCGNKNRNDSGDCERCNYSRLQSGDIRSEQGNVKLLINKIDVLQGRLDRLQMLYEGKTGAPDRGGMEPGKELSRIRRDAEEAKTKVERDPCPECNPDGDSSTRGKCKYCNGEGWWPCRKCGGDGVIKDSALGILTDGSPKCPKCHGGKWFGCGLCDNPAADLGNGKIRPGDGLCRRCHGLGHL